MDLFFQPSRGNPFCIEIGYFDTVLEIKEKIQKAKGIPISKQTLIFNNNILQDDLNVHYSDILDGSRINLLLPSEMTSANHSMKDEPSPLPPPTKIQVILKTPSSKLITLEMEANETIQRLKEKIHEIEGIPLSRMIIHANGVELHDHKSIHDCELSDNSVINVAIRSSSGSSSRQSSGGSPRMRIVVLTKCGTEKIPVDVNPLDLVGELRRKLEKMRLDLPQEGYFFIYKQIVMEDDRSFRWHHVCQGDTIEIFSGSVSGGS